MRSHTPVLVAAVLYAAACGTTKVKVVEHKVSAPGSPIAFSVSAIKYNKDKYDLDFAMTNEAASAVLIVAEDVRCGRGSTTGRLDGDVLGQRGKTINIAAGKAKTFSIGCETPGLVSGDFKITIISVYANASGDGVTKGEILASNVTMAVDPHGQVASGEPLTGSPPPEEPSKAKSAMNSMLAVLAPSSGTKSAPTTTAPTTTAPTTTAPTATAPPSSQASRPSDQSQPAQPSAKTHSEAHPVMAHPDWVIAVMDVEDTNSSNSKKALDKSLIQNLGDQLRVYIVQNGVRTIDRSAQERLVKEQIKREKSESYKSCYDDGCQIELGKALAASHILRARITRFGVKCVLNSELIDLRQEVTIGASTAQGDCGEEGFLAMCETVASGLLKTR